MDKLTLAILSLASVLGVQGCAERYIQGTDIPIAYWHDEVPECRHGSVLTQAELESRYPGLRWLDEEGNTIATPFEIGGEIKGACVYFSEDQLSEVAGFYEGKIQERRWELVGGLNHIGRFRKGSQCLTQFAGGLDGWIENYVWRIEYEDDSGATVRKKLDLISGEFPPGSLVFVFWVSEVNGLDDCIV